jgi:V/A-type H+/Na+-transporting ATPase subunit E
MGLDALTARLERDADAMVAAIREASEAQARACLAQADADAAQRREELLGRREQERREAIDRELADTRRRLRAELLAAQRALLDRVFARAQQLAESLSEDPGLRAAIQSHLHEVLFYLGDRNAQLRCPPCLGAQLEPLLAGRTGIELVVDEQAPLGIHARSRDGSLTIDNTLIARLERIRLQLEPMLLREALA